MSKTDKTAPWRVKTTFHPTYLIADHDHRGDEPCDLPDRPVLAWALDPSERSRCRWIASATFHSTGLARCGCSWCSGDFGQPPLRRLERYAGRRYTRGGWRDEY